MSYGGGFSTTSYGAQGGADGGGFMGGSQGGSQGAGGKGTYGKDTLRPVTIKQILEAHQPHPDGDFKIDDVEISQITFVGQIRNVSQQTTNITYKLDDGTGIVEVKQWIDVDAQNNMDIDANSAGGNKSGKLVEHEWVRVWGRLKAFSNKRHVGAHVIRPIADKNDINYHLLEATYVHLYFTRGPPDQVKQESQQANGMANGTGYGGAAMSADGLSSNTSATARRIYQTIKESPKSNEGLHVQHIAANLGVNVSDVLKAGDELFATGKIYQTLDDNTWGLMD